MPANLSVLAIPAELVLPYLLVMATPGPNLLVILRASLEPSTRTAPAAALGIACGASLAAAVAILGTAILPHIWAMETVGRFVFALLLARAGLATLRKIGQRRDVPVPSGARQRSHFRLGLLAAVSNPVTIPFFAGFFIGRIEVSNPWEAVVGCASVFVLAAAWFGVLGRLLSLPRWRAIYLQAGSWTDVVIGLALLGCAVLAIWPLLRS